MDVEESGDVENGEEKDDEDEKLASRSREMLA